MFLCTQICTKVNFFSICQNYGPFISEIGLGKLLFFCRLLTSYKMAPVVRNRFEIRSQSYFDAIIVSSGVLPSICEALHNMDSSVNLTHGSQIVFLAYSTWKSIVKTKIRESEENTWKNFVLAHPSYRLAKTYLNLMSPEMFWSIPNQYPDSTYTLLLL